MASPLPNPETPEPFTCPICYKDISAERPPTLNLDNCSCGEAGTSLNGDEQTFLDPSRTPAREVMIMDAIRTSVDGNQEDYEEQRVDNTPEKVDQEEDDQVTHDDDLPSQNRSSNLSFAMAAYLAAIAPEERSYHTSTDLDLDLELVPDPDSNHHPKNIHHLDLDLSLLEFFQPTISPSACATKASSSMRSSWSVRSWGSQSRNLSSESLVWTGGWLQEDFGEPLEMSWPPVLCGSGVLLQ